MAKKSPAQRANKKHEKEKQRQKKLARRQPPLSPEERWKPLTEGIEGLARRLDVDAYIAFEEAAGLAKQRPEVAQLWTTERVDALSTDEILVRLEGLGVTTDAESFAERALVLERTLLFSNGDWLPRLDEGNPEPPRTVHDRDFLRAANIILWERWLPDQPCDEDLNASFDHAWFNFDSGHTEEPFFDLLDVWEQLGPNAQDRLQRTPFGVDYTNVLLETTHAVLSELDELGPVVKALTILHAIVPALAPDRFEQLRALQKVADHEMATLSADSPADG
ncbi:MAG: hypothetical protein EXR69_06880 [Myxococcales bacterium]|nr:hypothetical protein [Myxococcales bacterium]